jgi:hypothetical protein
LIADSEQPLDVRIAGEEIARDLPDFRRVREGDLFDLDVRTVLLYPVIDSLGALRRAEVNGTRRDDAAATASGSFIWLVSFVDATEFLSLRSATGQDRCCDPRIMNLVRQ